MEPTLVGTWRLFEWTATIDGRPARPFGGNTTGLITYTADGRMWGTLMRVGRADVEAPTLASASVEERARAAAGYLNYAGTYRVEPGKVIHVVEVSLYPNWLGGEQTRDVNWVDGPNGENDLVLSALDHHPNGTEVFNRLRWRRIENWNE
jgi:Lipocalin-like domain